MTIQVGKTTLYNNSQKIKGEFVNINGAEFYKIGHYDQMRPFFISLVSHSDQWLFISSKGGLTAGRRNPDNALFPYYTDDKIHDSYELTGSKTVILATKNTQTYLWEPFSDRYTGAYKIERNLYKHVYGNQLIFEEINQDLGLTFSYRWAFSEKYGLVKKAQLTAHEAVKVNVLDGFQNLLPYGVNPKMQTERSTLLDAYKKNELLSDTGLGLFLLSSVPVDKAEPSEALKATTVWHNGLDVENYLLCINQLDDFRKGKNISTETDIRAERGAYLVQSTFDLNKNEEKTWYFTAELNQSAAQVATLNAWIKKGENLTQTLEQDIEVGTKALEKIVAASDGLQLSTDKNLTTRHFANTLFNVMRGGIFDNNYEVSRDDLLLFIKNYNKKIFKQHETALKSLPTSINYLELKKWATEKKDNDLQRLCLEYLPLTFSRRHGDPSRPWNRFSIEIADEFGNKKLYYQGNWRDIFQNWEALALSYPRYLESMITKFVNASTADGYNPYRITRDGIDWEIIEPDDPWSYIGYWGDHQIIYLLKLMEWSQAHQSGELQRMLLQKIYTYANVPYRIKSHESLLANPQDTIDFDQATQEIVEKRVAELGADGKLVQDESGIYYVNLAEKLLVSLLAKLSNYIPEGGIWMNTQRPEWNDANNALVGYGVSMVTLYYIRRFVAFCKPLFASLGNKNENITVSEEVAELFQSISKTFSAYKNGLDQPRTNQLRRAILDELGKAGETYRNRVYQGFSKKEAPISLQDLDAFFENVQTCTDHTIAANQREDKLYHSYNLMRVEADGGISVRYLYEMLEGQVGVLSAGVLNSEETMEVVKALKKSALYREDQNSYILYPDRQLPRFEAKNNIDASDVERSALLLEMVENGDRRIIEQDVNGIYHFNGNFNNGNDVAAVLDEINENEYPVFSEKEKNIVLDIFEKVFDHQSFTGRSGTFFGYEGLGCIYWHMVSKLIVAVEEKTIQAIENSENSKTILALTKQYYDVRSGLGTSKTPENYGAFPTDPYSHTPGNAGAQQPGMTGQVKEDVISRFAELGVWIKDGEIHFQPKLLKESEFLRTASTFKYIDLVGEEQHIELSTFSLAFTYCQVPVTYHIYDHSKMIIYTKDGQQHESKTLKLNHNWSNQLFERTGQITRIEVHLSSQDLM